MRNRITAQDAETLIALKLRASNTQIPLAEGGTLKATTPQGQILTIVSLLPQEGCQAKFVLPDFQDSNHRFIVCTEQDETGTPVQWVFPEMCFTYRGVTRENGTAEVDLDLPGEELGGRSIRDGLYFLKERWDPVIQFDDFREYMPPPGHPEFADRWLDMEDILEIIWCKESPTPMEDPIPVKEIPDREGKLKVRFSDQAADFIRQQAHEEQKEGLWDAMGSLAEDPFSSDVLGIEGTRGNYRVVKPGRD